jgi:DNA-binding PadR family transcriptional regulator
MSKRPLSTADDKRTRTDLDLFILALVNEGVATAYEMKVEAGLSPGATLPAITRLQNLGYLSAGEVGARNRTQLNLSRSGRTFLNTSWKRLLNGPVPSDLDSIIRIAVIGGMQGANRDAIRSFLKRASQDRHSKSAYRHKEAEEATAPTGAGRYRRMRALLDGQSLALEAKFLVRLMQERRVEL